MEIDWIQTGITIVGSGVAAYIAILSKVYRLERLLVEIRLQWTKDCEAHREKIYARINGTAKEIDGKVEKVKDEITGVHSLLDA